MIAKLADLMRYILYDGSQQKVPLEKEIAFLSNYIDLEKIRHNSNRTIEFAVKGKTEGTLIEPLLFVPLIENGFKHGINNTIENGWLKAVLQANNGDLCFEVENSVNKATVASEGGVGLTNLRKRLQLLYPGKHSFETENREYSFKAILKLTCNENISLSNYRG
jgi:LytS/YehU family sensor histidine kinase